MAKKFSFAKIYNTERLFDIDTSSFEYVSLQELFEDVDGDTEYKFPVRAIYINTKSEFGDAPVIATDNCYVNIPQHMLETCRAILRDPAAVQAINDGAVAFTVYEYEQKRFGRKCYSIRWADADLN